MKCDTCGGNVYQFRCAAFSCELPPVRCALHIDEQRHAALADQARDLAAEMLAYWIYPGERRPVVVKASSHDEAEGLIRKHQCYDGFPIIVFRIDEYARRQEDKDFRL